MQILAHALVTVEMCTVLACKADRTKWLKRDFNEISFDLERNVILCFFSIGCFTVYLQVLLHLTG